MWPRWHPTSPAVMELWQIKVPSRRFFGETIHRPVPPRTEHIAVCGLGYRTIPDSRLDFPMCTIASRMRLRAKTAAPRASRIG